MEWSAKSRIVETGLVHALRKAQVARFTRNRDSRVLVARVNNSDFTKMDVTSCKMKISKIPRMDRSESALSTF